ncbi:hypothetical protein [Constantimarinum furrinae]|nr:hypothetical protein [Constantimarinum furrinae]
MTYNYSICHPDKETIEYKTLPISDREVLEIAENYPWIEKMELYDSLNASETFYNPSLDFKCINNGRRFCLTAQYDDNKNLTFSLWYSRPKKVKIFFGLLGEKEKMRVDDVWSIDKNDSLKFLEYFVNGNYPAIESLYNA